MCAALCVAMCAAAAGCSVLDVVKSPDPPAPPPPHAPMASKRCTDFALLRMSDAAANGYDPALQEVVFQWSYKDCIALEDKPPQPLIKPAN